MIDDLSDGPDLNLDISFCSIHLNDEEVRVYLCARVCLFLFLYFLPLFFLLKRL